MEDGPKPMRAAYPMFCRSLPGLNRMVRPGGMRTSLPVRGLRPMPRLRGFTWKTPKPRSSIRSPRCIDTRIASNTASTASSAFTLVMSAIFETSLTMSSLIMPGNPTPGKYHKQRYLRCQMPGQASARLPGRPSEAADSPLTPVTIRPVSRAIPLVVLVGRPNVGKSTLFNRITRTRKAIVTPVAGTTRDLIEQQTSWQGVDFRLLDTGGMFGATEDPLQQLVVENGHRAIAQADLLVLVLDGQQGLIPGD